MSTPLTLYLILADATTTLSTASTVATTNGGFDATSIGTEVDALTGYGEMYTVANHPGTWPAGGSIGSPSGHGWLWDVTTLEGQTIAAGTWSATLTFNADAAPVINVYLRAYKRSSGGTYTAIGNMTATGQTINGFSNTAVSLSGSLPAMSFATGDKIYFDCWWNITSNPGGASGNVGYVRGPNAIPGDTSLQVATPGYAPTSGGTTRWSLPLRTKVRTPGTKSLPLRTRVATRHIRSLAMRVLVYGTNTVSLPLRTLVSTKRVQSLVLRVLMYGGNRKSLPLRTVIRSQTTRSLTLRVPVYTASQTYSVQVGGQSIFVVAGSLQFQQTIGRRATANFILKTDASTHFQQYQQIAIYDRFGMLVFSGYITNEKEQQPGFQPSLLHTITCTDQHYLADKRRIAMLYTNKTCGYIAQDIVRNILSQEGVTVGQIYDGQTPSFTLYPSTTLYPGGNIGIVPSATFAYCTIAQALDALVTAASNSGVLYYWMIDQFKQLWFVPYTTVVNSTLVDGSQIDQKTTPPYVQRANPTYRNTQYIVGGVQQTVQQTETRHGDGVTVAWTMGYELALVPTITVNGTSKRVGIKGVDSGKDFYWAAGDPIITQDTSGVKLVSTDTLQVVYIGQYPAAIISQNSAQVAYAAMLDGSSGIVEDTVIDSTITSISNGLSEAGQLLTRYATQGTLLQFNTLQSGYAPGQLIPVNLPQHQLNNVQMLISEVDATDQTDGYNIWYTVHAVLGPYDVTWVDFYSKMLQQAQPANSINVGVTQTISLLANFNASITPTARLSVNVYACPVVNTTLFPSVSLYPC